jgi:hypothetical protein
MMIMSLKEKKIKCRTIINLLKFLKLFFFVGDVLIKDNGVVCKEKTDLLYSKVDN